MRVVKFDLKSENKKKMEKHQKVRWKENSTS
jgi:hypothetical protein